MPGTDVYILGQKYTIKGDASAEHIRELARFIEGRLNEILARAPHITPTKAMVLTLFNLAEEIDQLRAERQDVVRRIGEKTDLLANLFE
ncbi:MAG: cell division protein ZapA [Nitrospirota bacterium]|jgi:cell division protein ZapA